MKRTFIEVPLFTKKWKELGLTDEELAFYDALTKPRVKKDLKEHKELIELTKELTETLKKNKTIDWQKRESARSSMKRSIKRLLKKYDYPPEGWDDATQIVIQQCELWADNIMEV